jgi:dienelactone hydrolase
MAWATVHQLCDLRTPEGGPFPNDAFTVADFSQNTSVRVNLPKPDCAMRRSDCEDLYVLNTLDGFSLQPRLSIPFDGPIDLRTVTSDTVYVLRLDDTLGGGRRQTKRIAVNRILWDSDTTTLVAEPDEILEQHTRYGIVVTTGVRDTDGNPVAIPSRCARTFTTQSVTAALEKIRRQIKSSVPDPAEFRLGPGGARTVFSFDQIQGMTLMQQTNVAPQFTPAAIPLAMFNLIPGAVGQIAFGKYVSPDYMVHPGEFIPPVATLAGTPQSRRMNDIYFNLYLPSSRQPTAGWPVALFTHSANGNKEGERNVAASLAAHGIATITINHLGHGGGPLSTLRVTMRTGASVTVPAAGRGIDQNGDGVIGVREGDSAAAPRGILLASDGIRQTVADMMQLVRVIQAGVDVDGDGRSDLDPARIYSVGASLGGATAMVFMAIEPDVQAGVFLSPAGADSENFRLSPLNRTPNVAALLASRVPSLINGPGVASVGGISIAAPLFNENKPFRDQSPTVNSVPGATAIQVFLDRLEWASEAGNLNAYARHLRARPLRGVREKSVLVHFGTGDQGVPNMNMSRTLVTGELLDRAMYYRHDIAIAEHPTLPKDSHVFSLGFRGANVDIPGVAAILSASQAQVAVFLASHGANISQPQPVRYFESPVRQPLPEGLNYIP